MKISVAVSVLSAAGMITSCAGTNSKPKSESQISPVISENDPAVKKLMLCGGGMDNKFDANLTASVANDLHSGSLSAGVEHQLHTAYFAGADPKDATVEKGYEAFLGCLRAP